MNNKILAVMDSVRHLTDNMYIGKIDADRYAVVNDTVHGPYTKISILGADIISVIGDSDGIHLIGSAGIEMKSNNMEEFQEAIKELIPTTLKSEKIQASISEVLKSNKEKIYNQQYEKIDADIVELSGMISLKIGIAMVFGLGHKCVIVNANDRFQFIEGLYSLDTNTWIVAPLEGRMSVNKDCITVACVGKGREYIGSNLTTLVAPPYDNIEFEKLPSKSNEDIYYSEITDEILLKSYKGVVVQELLDRQSGETVLDKVAGVCLYGKSVLVLQNDNDRSGFNTYLIDTRLHLIGRANVIRVIKYKTSGVTKDIISVEIGKRRLIVIIDNGIIKILLEHDTVDEDGEKLSEEMHSVINRLYDMEENKQAFNIRVVKHRKYEL